MVAGNMPERPQAVVESIDSRVTCWLDNNCLALENREYSELSLVHSYVEGVSSRPEMSKANGVVYASMAKDHGRGKRQASGTTHFINVTPRKRWCRKKQSNVLREDGNF